MRATWGQELREPPCHSRGAIIVKTQPIDTRLVFFQAKDAGLGVSFLSFSGDRAQLDEAEPQGRPRKRHLSVLVAACGQTHRVREVQTPQLLAQARVARGSHPSQGRRGCQSRRLQQLERVEGEVMSVFGVESEEKRAQAGVEHGGWGLEVGG